MSKQYFCFRMAVLGITIMAMALSEKSVAVEFPEKENRFDSILLSQQKQRRANNTYTVKLGDTLSGIGARHGLTLNQMLALNPQLQNNPNLILVGQKINVGGARVVRVTPRNSSRQNTWQPRRVFTRRPVANRPSSRPPTPRPAVNTPTPQPAVNTPTPRPVVNTPRRQSPWTFNLPNQIRPGSSRFAARRGSPECYVNKNDKAKTLMPDNNFGYTLKDYPTFFWYQPELSVSSVPVAFRLSKASVDNPQRFKKVYETEFVSSGSGIISFTLPPDASPLTQEEKYVWQLLIKCESGGSTLLKGYIERLSTNNPQLERELANASIEEYPKILAKAGVWYDILPIMSDLLQKEPNNSRLIDNWAEIFAAIGYEDLSQLLSNNTLSPE